MNLEPILKIIQNAPCAVLGAGIVREIAAAILREGRRLEHFQDRHLGFVRK